jgi:cation diffusion facilitator CzcD-associated flavoprotein CzcO
LRGEVLVIGAGPAGLASAYRLKGAGIPYRVVDRADVIASTWAFLYPSLRLNTARFVSHLPGQRMPLSADIYPTARQFYEYCLDYAARHQFNIELGITVKRVAPSPHPPSPPLRMNEVQRGKGGAASRNVTESAWWVETNHWSEEFSAVIIASGRFGNPQLPPVPGLDTFTGRVLHASQYHGVEGFEGQQVIAVGAGPSGADIAVELATAAAHPVLYSVRHDIVLARRHPFGIPETAWKILIDPLPKQLRKWLTDRILYMGYRDVSGHGLTFAPNREDRRGTGAPVRGPELIAAIRSGGVRPVVGVRALRPSARPGFGCVELDDGSEYEVNAIIFGTGYRPTLSFLDFPFSVDKDGWPLRAGDDGSQTFYERGATEVAGYPGLYLVGRFYRGLGPLHNIRSESADAVRRIADQRRRRQQPALPDLSKIR